MGKEQQLPMSHVAEERSAGVAPRREGGEGAAIDPARVVRQVQQAVERGIVVRELGAFRDTSDLCCRGICTLFVRIS
ncbi:unnamed protein product [Mycena citricolor]|uniref:Uncharacterized protein n=1 Tax=Mycena citricolor TaxID=2018698 RepID=A0AAD2Q2P9_9AGAR|nr:unnamed protein product [Mycena citricolor]